MKMFTHPTTGKTFKTGRNRPDAGAVAGAMKLSWYRKPPLPEPPGRVNYTLAAEASMQNVFGNDVEGDCTIACVGHLEGVFTGNAGGPVFIPTLSQINDMYSRCEGPPGFPAIDWGCDEVTVLNDWRRNGLAGHQIKAWMTVDATNIHECKTALWLFENLVLTVELPDAWISPFPSESGFTWNVAGPPDMSNGHCIAAVGYDFRKPDRHGFKIATWGMLGRLTPAALSMYMTESAGGGAYVVLSDEIINRAKAKAPNGMDWGQLQSDFAHVR